MNNRFPDKKNAPRVVVTGMGAVTPLGMTRHDLLEGLQTGRSGIQRWQKYPGHRYSQIGGAIPECALADYFEKTRSMYAEPMIKKTTRLLRATPYAGRMTALAALEAMNDSRMEIDTAGDETIGHVLGGHNLNMNYIFQNTLEHEQDPDLIDPRYGLLTLDTDVLSVISELLHLKGPSFTIGAACASGNLAIMAGLDLIRSGRVDTVLVTGGLIDLDPVILTGWGLIDAIVTDKFLDEPERASRPFDAKRSGFVPGHCAAALVLESLENARERGAFLYGEILGGGGASDASRKTQPHIEGQVRAMQTALDDAGMAPEDINYINAHAPSTPLGDRVEVQAIKMVLGPHAYRMPVNSTKSLIGHGLCAAGVVECVATLLQMQEGFVHPTLNQEYPDPELDLDFVPNKSRPYQIDAALSNSFGFGGINSSIVVKAIRKG
ncbi:beta-ketoacyl-[acyl-carrier-protein] synthase family protein [Candidatus Nitronereus thalassa]|uniref:Beta-ketoacyl-[acyl-carrier-protein] synthase family protein n=1 Tax=Candidatus Nitronereus thalassa TaxID=3020898 RepID=A0ABU3K4B3_9BACT|nr:beta-ketoacyl-[acyl-carrier-protein] synthase family protein [Candidatus Nitronereus thalassa]MDT7041212.1 beta-ketoacyl-[acyl-carrier-protein] synthase family protein [Candidatus Nitronereus thalassa]